MKNLLWITIAGAGLLSAQTPDFSGVWKANAEKSKGLGGAYLTIITQKDGHLMQTASEVGPRGERRVSYNWDLSGKEGHGTLGGLPLKSTATYEGQTLNVSVVQPNNRSMTAKYMLSDGGNTLTIDMAMGQRSQTLVLEKQPDSAGEALRQPEATAESTGHYKNLKLLGGAPASSIGDTMSAFAFALGKNCQFCHVQGDFASDEKPEKATARKMIIMATAINKDNFGGHMAVRCYTCHQGNQHPPGPKF